MIALNKFDKVFLGCIVAGLCLITWGVAIKEMTVIGIGVLIWLPALIIACIPKRSKSKKKRDHVGRRS